MKDITEYYKYDMHVHTAESSRCGKIEAKEAVRLYKEKGFSGIFISDHFKGPTFDFNDVWQETMDQFLLGYKLAKEEGDRIGLDVFLSVEFRLPNKAVVEALAVGITEDVLRRYEGINKYPIERLLEVANKEGFLLFQAHPFRKNNEVIPPEYVHGYEVMNGNLEEADELKAYNLCQESGKLMLAGSDFHNVGALNKCGIYTYEPIKSSQDLVDKIKTNEYGLFSSRPISEDNPIKKNKRYIHIEK